jgi:hypothetical protein
MPDKFPGFQTPKENWSKLPHQLIGALPVFTSEGEIKVVLYILRHTWGYREFGQPKRITVDEFMHGRKTTNLEDYPTGRMDNGVGMSKDAILRGLRRAEKHGFIEIEIDDSDKARIKKHYVLRMSESQTPDSSGVRKSDPKVRKSDSQVRESDSNGTESVPRSEKETLERNSVERNEEKESMDYLQHCVQIHQNQQRESVWTATPEGGGDDPFADGPVNAFAEILAGIIPANLPRKKQDSWARKLREIAEEWSTEGAVVTAEVMEKAIRAIPDSDIGWKTYTTPYAGRFDEDIGPLLLQAMEDEEESEPEEQVEEVAYEPTYFPMLNPEPQRPMTEDEKTWSGALNELQLQMTKATFDTYVKDTRIVSHEDGTIVVGAPNALARDWLENRLLTTIERTLVGIVGHSVKVEVVVE